MACWLYNKTSPSLTNNQAKVCKIANNLQNFFMSIRFIKDQSNKNFCIDFYSFTNNFYRIIINQNYIFWLINLF